MAESPKQDGAPKKTAKRAASGRLILSKRVLEDSHPGMQFLAKKVPGLVACNTDDPQWMTIGALLKDLRNLILKYPFCEESVAVKICTEFKMIYQAILKKGRLPEEEKFYKLALTETANIMTTRRGGKPFLITSPDARIDPDLIEESVNSTRNPFGIRANNTFATEELDEEIWGKFVRLKVESPDEREEAIPELVEGDAMLYLYLHALNKRGLTDLELVHLYLLLLDPSYHDHRQRFAFRDTPIDKRTREILAHPIRYGTGITYYTGALERTLREELSQEYASDTFDALVGRSFKTKESRPGAVVAMGTIRENMERLLLPENRLAVSDLPPLPPPQEGPENWKLPNPSWRRFTQHLTAVAMSNHLVPFGQFRYWEKEVKQAG